MNDILPTTGRLAGIDYGTVRIGIAITDPDRILASPYETYRRRNADADAKYFKKFAVDENVVGFVVGLPLHLDGRVSEKAKEAMEFGEWLRKETELSVAFRDERYTSVEAGALLSGLTNKGKRKRCDQVSAHLILMAYLEQ
jgi:putative Holliday junction resolvase